MAESRAGFKSQLEKRPVVSSFLFTGNLGSQRVALFKRSDKVRTYQSVLSSFTHPETSGPELTSYKDIALLRYQAALRQANCPS